MFSPLPEVGSPFVAGTRFDLSSRGYAAAEYAFSGRAGAYGHGDHGVAVIEHADFTTRVLVHRPADPAAFSGTVWIEWLNVSGGLDAAPDWIFTHTELMRRGAAWVGVSAQKSGVEGGAGILGMPSLSLVRTNPARYGALHHPGDRFSYDIYAQVGAAVRTGSGTILDGLAVERVLAIGQSQSAYRLTTYVNEIDPVTAVHDGFLIHARGRAAAPLDDDGDPAAALGGGPVVFRGDLRVPVLCVESETDLMNLDYLAARQDDDHSFVVWEIAGASHGDVYTFVAGPIDTGRLPIAELAAAWVPVSEVYGMALDKAVNAGPQHYVMNAAVSQLDRWVRHGTRPAPSPPLEVRDGAFVTDEHGITRGGIRTPHTDVPTAVLSGLGNSGHPIAFLCGSTTPFDAATLGTLYPSKESYLGRFTDATAAAVANGFVLADDAAEISAIAAVNAPL
ncbi:MAG TPA: alpha/beta hydrolase domain-containing protein [Acidimicrobiales bacterium]|nr:alpha/beta hydrolase domain-containing protein [Acidimicrobiales bacterium]